MSAEIVSGECETSSVVSKSREDPAPLVHDQALKIIMKNLREILENDPVLREIVKIPAELLTADDLDSLIALERGQAMSIIVDRAVGQPIRAVVPENARVVDLKRAVKRAFCLEQMQLSKQKVAISWKYVWRTNWLHFNNMRLKDDSAKLKDLGIANKSHVGFVKKRKGD